MLEFLCCKATEVAAGTEELVATAKDKIKGGVNEFTQARLRDALVGEPVNQVHEGPDVYVMIKDVKLKDAEFTGLNAFTLKGVDCIVEVKVQGTKAQMAGMAGAHAAGKLFDFMSQGEKGIAGALGLSALGLADKASASAAEAAAGLKDSAASGEDATVLEFSIILDLEKTAGIEEVKAEVVAISSDTDAINKVMSLDMMKRYVETALSQRATRAVTDWQNQTFTLDVARSKGGVLIASGAAMGGEILEKGRAKGAEAVEAGKAKGAELVEAGKAKGAEVAEAVKAKTSNTK